MKEMWKCKQQAPNKSACGWQTALIHPESQIQTNDLSQRPFHSTGFTWKRLDYKETWIQNAFAALGKVGDNDLDMEKVQSKTNNSRLSPQKLCKKQARWFVFRPWASSSCHFTFLAHRRVPPPLPPPSPWENEAGRSQRPGYGDAEEGSHLHAAQEGSLSSAK